MGLSIGIGNYIGNKTIKSSTIITSYNYLLWEDGVDISFNDGEIIEL